jgi:hypothetical protein
MRNYEALTISIDNKFIIAIKEFYKSSQWKRSQKSAQLQAQRLLN